MLKLRQLSTWTALHQYQLAGPLEMLNFIYARTLPELHGNGRILVAPRRLVAELVFYTLVSGLY